MYCRGGGREPLLLDTAQLWHRERGSKAASLAWRWGGGYGAALQAALILENQGISNFLSLMWKTKMPACLPLLRLIDKYSGSLKNWEIEIYMVGIVSLQHFWWCMTRDFLKDFSLAKSGRLHSPQVIHIPLLFSSLLSSEFDLLQEAQRWEKSAVLCMVLYPLCILVFGNKHVA